ncbi:hypothetical protein J6A31_08935 [bacterium]|nr:hypothetical protein [bacterium]
MKYDIVLIEKPEDEGLTISEITTMFEFLKEETAFPLEICAELQNSVAMGFITTSASDSLNYDHQTSGLTSFISNILDDMNNEEASKTYSFKKQVACAYPILVNNDAIKIYLTRNIEDIRLTAANEKD